jgi:hypothetical protein
VASSCYKGLGQQQHRSDKVKLTEELEKLEAQPNVEKGQVESVEVTQDGSTKTLSLGELATQLGFSGAEGYVDEHPEGSDRGGFVPTLFFFGKSEGRKPENAFYDENGGEWTEC